MPEATYANIALDIEARELRDRLFAYQIPEHLSDSIFIGSQVLVPFGAQNSIGGYVVSITDSRPIELKRIRKITEVVDTTPLFDDEYIDFLNWLAFTSCANLSDVIAAALPSFLAPRLKRKAQLTESGQLLANSEDRLIVNDRKKLLALFKDQSTGTFKAISLSALKHRFLRLTGQSQSAFYKQLNLLKEDDHLEVITDTGSKVKAKTQVLVESGDHPPETNRHKEIVAIIERFSGSIVLKDLVKEAGTTHATLKKLAEKKIVKLTVCEVIRDPMASIQLERKQPGKLDIELTDAQKTSLSVLMRELELCLSAKENSAKDKNKPEEVKPWLLHGVTGSGKTEVYLRLVERTIESGKSALLLVPEISLTPQLASLLVNRFGDTVAIWHSAISAGERLDTWKRLKAGTARVLLGARSAILANVKDLALIILDEEHDSSYKQSSPSPRYNAKTVALEKARREGALIVLGSATPDMVTYQKALEDKRILELPQRVHKQEMPAVNIVDMRKELESGNRSIFSVSLAKAIEDRLSKKEQVILLMNRRGYASHVFCRACGYVARCKNCSVSLVFHRYSDNAIKRMQNHSDSISDTTPKEKIRGYLACHHCGTSKTLTIQCPECSSPFLKEYGLGTQKVEESIAKQFPSSRTVRLDSDVTTKKGEFKRVLDIFNRGEADILIGTQMVAKGLDIPNVTLVGVLAADASLNMPDYRSTERGYQLLSQVAGRAGRGHRPGSVIFQTYNPELNIFQWAKSHDYHSFVESELQNRQEFAYPPYSRILRIIVSGLVVEDVEKECEILLGDLRQFLDNQQTVHCDNVEILGPVPCIIERVRGNFRYHLVIKIKDNDLVLDGLLGFLRIRKNHLEVRTIVDVDALDLL